MEIIITKLSYDCERVVCQTDMCGKDKDCGLDLHIMNLYMPCDKDVNRDEYHNILDTISGYLNSVISMCTIIGGDLNTDLC